MNRRAMGSIAITFAVVAGASSASAHSHLVKAVPAAGSSVKPPSEIALTFSEAIVPAFTGLALTAAGGATIATGKAAGEGTAVAVPIAGALAPGVYTVRWHAVSVDTHKTQGSFRFTVTP